MAEVDGKKERKIDGMRERGSWFSILATVMGYLVLSYVSFIATWRPFETTTTAI